MSERTEVSRGRAVPVWFRILAVIALVAMAVGMSLPFPHDSGF